MNGIPRLTPNRRSILPIFDKLQQRAATLWLRLVNYFLASLETRDLKECLAFLRRQDTIELVAFPDVRDEFEGRIRALKGHLQRRDASPKSWAEVALALTRAEGMLTYVRESLEEEACKKLEHQALDREKLLAAFQTLMVADLELERQGRTWEDINFRGMGPRIRQMMTILWGGLETPGDRNTARDAFGLREVKSATA